MSESKLLVKDKQVVVPGQPLAEGMEYLPSFGTYRLGEQIRAQQLGLLTIDGKVLRTIPIAGAYLPRVNDVVIGQCVDILMSGWRFEFNCPYSAVLPLKDASFDYIRKGEDLTNYFNLEDWVLMKITQVTSQNLIDVTMRGPGLRKLVGGRLINIGAHKIPRVIGKRGSMVSMIKRATDCQVVVGQNGFVWLSGEAENEMLAYKAIKLIESEAHVPGLTDRVKAFLEKETGQKIEMIEEPEQEENEEMPREDRRDDRRDDRPRGPPRRDERRGPPRRNDRRDDRPRGPPREHSNGNRGPPRNDDRPRGPPRQRIE